MSVPTTLKGRHDGCGGSVVFRPVTHRRELMAGQTVQLSAVCRQCGETLSVDYALPASALEQGDGGWRPASARPEGDTTFPPARPAAERSLEQRARHALEQPLPVELPLAVGAEHQQPGGPQANAWPGQGGAATFGEGGAAVSDAPAGGGSGSRDAVVSMDDWRSRSSRALRDLDRGEPLVGSGLAPLGADEPGLGHAPAGGSSADDDFMEQFARRFAAAREAVRRVRDELPDVLRTDGQWATPQLSPAPQSFAAAAVATEPIPPQQPQHEQSVAAPPVEATQPPVAPPELPVAAEPATPQPAAAAGDPAQPAVAAPATPAEAFTAALAQAAAQPATPAAAPGYVAAEPAPAPAPPAPAVDLSTPDQPVLAAAPALAAATTLGQPAAPAVDPATLAAPASSVEQPVAQPEPVVPVETAVAAPEPATPAGAVASVDAVAQPEVPVVPAVPVAQPEAAEAAWPPPPPPVVSLDGTPVAVTPPAEAVPVPTMPAPAPEAMVAVEAPAMQPPAVDAVVDAPAPVEMPPPSAADVWSGEVATPAAMAPPDPAAQAAAFDMPPPQGDALAATFAPPGMPAPAGAPVSHEPGPTADPADPYAAHAPEGWPAPAEHTHVAAGTPHDAQHHGAGIGDLLSAPASFDEEARGFDWAGEALDERRSKRSRGRRRRGRKPEVADDGIPASSYAEAAGPAPAPAPEGVGLGRLPARMQVLIIVGVMAVVFFSAYYLFTTLGKPADTAGSTTPAATAQQTTAGATATGTDANAAGTTAADTAGNTAKSAGTGGSDGASDGGTATADTKTLNTGDASADTAATSTNPDTSDPFTNH